MILNKLGKLGERGTPVVHITLSKDEFSHIINSLDTKHAIRKTLNETGDCRVIFSYDAVNFLVKAPDKSWRGAIYR